jgi:hypothetical protein
MSNNKQSSIDILCGKLAMKLGIPQAITFYIDHQEEIAEAKAMHKQEIIKAAYSNMNAIEEDPMGEAEQYYKETFGGNYEQQ